MTSTTTSTTLVWNGVVIESRPSDKYVNATQMARAFNKKFSHWYDTDIARNTVAELERDLNSGGDISRSHPKYIKVLDVRKGNSTKFTQGSWIHPDLCGIFAQWLSPIFAVKVGRWLKTLFTTGKVELESKEVSADAVALRRRVEEQEQQLMSLQQELKEKEEQMHRLNAINLESLTYKKNRLKEETIYIASTKNYAQQGIFKVGRTAQKMKMRSAQHNVTHVEGDKVKVLREFKVGDSKVVEANLHSKMKGLLLFGETEFYLCPYNLLERLVDLMTSDDHGHNEEVNKVIDIVHTFRCKSFDKEEWTQGIPPEVFEDVEDAAPIEEKKEAQPVIIELKEAKEILASFDTADMSESQRKNFLNCCMVLYRHSTGTDQTLSVVIWTALQLVIIEQLNIAKRAFRAKEWRDIAKEVAKEQQVELVIKQNSRALVTT